GYIHRHGPARNLREMLAQEGAVLVQAGCTGPLLDADDLAYTREVLIPFLEATDMRTAVECLFGDAAARTLGFTPRGLSPWAGVALALHDARRSGKADLVSEVSNAAVEMIPWGEPKMRTQGGVPG